MHLLPLRTIEREKKNSKFNRTKRRRKKKVKKDAIMFDCLKSDAKKLTQNTQSSTQKSVFQPPRFAKPRSLHWKLALFFAPKEKPCQIYIPNEQKKNYPDSFVLVDKKNMDNIHAASVRWSKIRAHRESKNILISSCLYGFHKYNVLTVSTKHFFFCLFVYDALAYWLHSKYSVDCRQS